MYVYSECLADDEGAVTSGLDLTQIDPLHEVAPHCVTRPDGQLGTPQWVAICSVYM